MISNVWKRLLPGRLRLRSKLLATYMLLTVVPMALLGYVTYAQYSQSIEEQIGEYMPRFLSQANANIEKHVDELSRLPDLLYNSEDIVAILRRVSYQSRSDANRDQFTMTNYLTRTFLNGNYEDVIGVFVFSNGRLFASAKTEYTGFGGNASALPGEAPEGILLPSEAGLQFENGQPYFLIKQQIEDFDNRRNLGTVYIAVDLSYLEEALRDFEPNVRADLWITDAEGERIYHSNSAMIGTIDADLREYPIRDGSFRTSAQGEPRLMSLSESERYGWVLVHSIPLRYLTERTDLVRNVTIFVFIAIVAMTLALSVYVSSRVTHPLRQLSRLMKEVEMGNFQVDLKPSSNDEVGALARSFNSMIATIRELIDRNYRIEIRQKEAELYALQSQINPHFMYNTLETILTAVEEGDNDAVVEMVTMLGRMLRFSVGNKTKYVTIAEEVQHVRDYLTIQQFRFEERLRFDIQLGGGGDEPRVAELYTPKFILQPIVENSIKYGLEARRGVCVRIRTEREFNARSGEEDVVFRIHDDEPGMPPERLRAVEEALRSGAPSGQDSGFGLSNVHARLGMMLGAEYGLQVDSVEGKGTEVIVRIPAIPVPHQRADRIIGGEGATA